MRSYIPILLAAISFFISDHLHADGNKVVIHNDKAEISLKDHIRHPLYWWPNTLLSVDLEGGNHTIDKANYVLINRETGKQLPFQLIPPSADGKNATLFFLSDLPSKGEYNYVLQKGKPESFEAVSIEQESGYYRVTTDKFSVRIPSSRSGISADIPGPVMSISKDKQHWKGRSFFDSKAGALSSLQTELISAGPVFATFQLTYTFTNNAVYTVWVRCVKGYDFIELKEEMHGFPIDQKIHWNIVWENFSPTHRQAPNHPYGQPKEEATGFGRYDWEKIDQTMLNSHHGINKEVSPDGKMPIDLGLYGNWPAQGNVTSIVFWDEKKDESIGLFAKDIAYWNDNQYAIWHDTRDISVKFFYKDNRLKWAYPVISGTRYTALSFYPHEKDIAYMEHLESLTQPVYNPDGTSYRVSMGQMSYNSFLQNRYSTIDLNKVKDWCLTYPETARIPESPFDENQKTTVKDLEQTLIYGTYSNELPVSGTCQNGGYGPVSSRIFYQYHTPQMNMLLPELSKDQRERMIAMYLVHTYIAAGEDLMPMRHMLSGHPNFLSDVKTIPAFASYLFPEHPKAKEWAELFEKYVELNAFYHARPDVKSWDAKGGRWTENINAYLWAYIRPTLRAGYLLELKDGQKRLANKSISQIASYVLNAVSAPFDGGSLLSPEDNHHVGSVTPANGPHRVIPPQGAHSVRRMLPSAYWRWGKELEHYDPLLSENMRYLARPEFYDTSVKDRSINSFNCMYPLDTDDSGTPPLLESIKMTGYGIILRAAVGTKDELSIHLEQIDNGPNYRWGMAGDGGCGTIYFYAAGKSYSDNGKEDVGDRRLQDTDLITGFGAFKDGRFKGIGKGDLTRPLYDLSVGQFAEIRSSEERQYAWPEYKSRSIMLVGSDYFLIFDDVYNQNMSTRLSWFTRPDEDLPELEVVKGGGANYTYSTKKPEYSTHAGRETKGVWFDGTGDFLTFVSHKKGYVNTETPYGCIVSTPEGNTDYIFRTDQPVEVDENKMVFSGTAGFVRHKPTHTEVALFQGTRIGANGFEIKPHHPEAGLSAVVTDKERIKGQYYCMDASVVSFTWKDGMPDGLTVYVDGIKQKATVTAEGVHISFPAGKHIWNITKGLPDVVRPQIQYTVNKGNKVEVSVSRVPGAQQYRFEYSTDAGKTWIWEKEHTQSSLTVKPQQHEKKGYIRVSALNSEHTSLPSAIYPVYFTSEKPHYPDGLMIKPDDYSVQVTWGKVLGCKDYKLYKKNGNQAFRLIYSGEGNTFEDKQYKKGDVYEYAVSALNGNGESQLCHPVTTDLNSWLNFVPVKDEPFRRVVAKEDPVDNEGNTTPFYYPE